MGSPVNGIAEVAGPQRVRLDELGRLDLGARHDPREVVTDPDARYFSAKTGRAHTRARRQRQPRPDGIDDAFAQIPSMIDTATFVGRSLSASMPPINVPP